MKKSERIYVAGHRGLLGSALLRNLVSKGYSEILTRTSTELDLTNQADTFRFLQSEKPDYVFLAAAKVGGIQANLQAPAEFLYQNLSIQNNVIEGSYRAGVKKLLFVGSSCIYPKNVSCPIKEESFLTGPFEPTNEGYALAKATGIRMCQFYRKQFGADFIAANPTNLFGINDQYDPVKSHLLPALIRKVHFAKLEGKNEIEIWGSGKPLREFMLSDDCADALVFLMEKYSDSGIVNVGTGIEHSVLELAQITAKVLGASISIRTDPSKPDGMMRKVLDVSLLGKMGWKSRFSLEEGIHIAYKDFLSKLKS